MRTGLATIAAKWDISRLTARSDLAKGFSVAVTCIAAVAVIEDGAVCMPSWEA